MVVTQKYHNKTDGSNIDKTTALAFSRKSVNEALIVEFGTFNLGSSEFVVRNVRVGFFALPWKFVANMLEDCVFC